MLISLLDQTSFDWCGSFSPVKAPTDYALDAVNSTQVTTIITKIKIINECRRNYTDRNSRTAAMPEADGKLLRNFCTHLIRIIPEVR